MQLSRRQGHLFWERTRAPGITWELYKPLMLLPHPHFCSCPPRLNAGGLQCGQALGFLTTALPPVVLVHTDLQSVLFTPLLYI